MLHHSPSALDKLLADPLISRMMQADKVDPAILRQDLTSVAVRLSARPRKPALNFANALVRFGTEPRAALLDFVPPRADLRCESRVCR